MFCPQTCWEEVASGGCSRVSDVVSAQGTNMALVHGEVEAPKRAVDPWCFLWDTVRENAAERIQITLLLKNTVLKNLGFMGVHKTTHC